MIFLISRTCMSARITPICSFILAQCPRTTFIPPPSLLLDSSRRSNRNKGAYRETCSLPQESSGTLSVESTAATLLPEEYNDNDMDCKCSVYGILKNLVGAPIQLSLIANFIARYIDFLPAFLIRKY